MSPFLVVGLPRSRTAWLANFLSYGESFCYHEPTIGCADVADLRMGLYNGHRPVMGGADTGALFIIDQIKASMPDLRLLVIERSVEDVFRSCEKAGLPVVREDLEREHQTMRLSASLDGAKRVRFDEIDNSLESIWRFCVGKHSCFDGVRAAQLRDLKVEALVDRYDVRVKANLSAFRSLVGGA